MNHKSWIRFLVLFVAVVLGLAGSGCDVLNETGNPEELIDQAKAWHKAELASAEGPAKSDADPDPALLLHRFFPDWNAAAVVTGPAGKSAVYATLGPDARVSFDSTRAIVRTIIISTDETGGIGSGEIVEFVAGDAAALENVGSLVWQYLANDFEDASILVARYSVRYKPMAARLHRPQREAVDLGFRYETRTVTSAGKRAETVYCMVLDIITYGVSVGDNDFTWNTDVYLDCWSEDGNVLGDEGATGDGGTGGAGGNSEYDGTETDIGDVVSKAHLESVFEGCGVKNESSAMGKAYERVIRNVLDMDERAGTNVSGSQLDGYTSNNYNGITWINSIMEAKFSEGASPFTTAQTTAHLQELNAVYYLHPEGTNVLGPPLYYAVTQYSGSNMKLNPANTMIAKAEELGVAVVHLSIRELPFNKYILFGNLLTDMSLIGWRDFNVEIPESWIDNAPWSLPFSIDCEVVNGE
ncbi:MAG: hypothetical protein AAF564_18525 [Bacteroidota bacterium]